MMRMEINYNSGKALQSFMEKHDLGMRKKYGQNFLVNSEARQKLADALEAEPGDEVWEIGPGLGAMTRHLLDKNFHVTAFEIDPGFLRLLPEIFKDEAKFRLIAGDVMKTWKTQKPARYLLGNLPYNIAAALIGDMIEARYFFKNMVVTVQKELGLRMTALPGSQNYSSFSVLCSSVYKVKKLINIHASSFYPKPHVDSCGLKLELDSQINKYPEIFYPLVRSLFSRRRKVIKNNLADFIRATESKQDNTEKINEICMFVLNQNRLSGMERAENLVIETFFGLAQTLENMRK